VEDRLSANVVRAWSHHALRASAFAASTRTTAAPHAQLTGGSAVGLDLALPEKLTLAVDVEVARSYYARLDGAAAGTPELAGQGTVKLERAFTVLPPRGGT